MLKEKNKKYKILIIKEGITIFMFSLNGGTIFMFLLKNGLS